MESGVKVNGFCLGRFIFHKSHVPISLIDIPMLVLNNHLVDKILFALLLDPYHSLMKDNAVPL